MTPGAPLTSMGRDEILRRFEALLDSALTSEAPPSGIDAEILALVTEGATPGGDEDSDRRCDSYALWTAMTALTQEIKLQGRAFQELNHTLAGQTEKIAEELRAVYAERERTLQRETQRRCRKDILGALIDLRDRLGRGLESVRAREMDMAAAARAGWWRFCGKQRPAPDALAALIRGYELGIERLDQTLDEFNAREIRCQGETFDPRRMNAIDSEESPAVPGGTVLEVYRSGYEWNGEIFRPAQVKVSRAGKAQ
jgi:molecular chaperone GrpE (heat shock protein)